MDRTYEKPNILLTKTTAYLIDHELGFYGISQAHQDLIDGRWDAAFSVRHIFVSYLKRAIKETKVNYFDTFEEYLRIMNVKDLVPYFEQLGRHGYVCRDKIIIPHI